ncbi:hypothetical protein O9G_006325, partial [Rozella allomycis CSF55]
MVNEITPSVYNSISRDHLTLPVYLISLNLTIHQFPSFRLNRIQTLTNYTSPCYTFKLSHMNILKHRPFSIQFNDNYKTQSPFIYTIYNNLHNIQGTLTLNNQTFILRPFIDLKIELLSYDYITLGDSIHLSFKIDYFNDFELKYFKVRQSLDDSADSIDSINSISSIDPSTIDPSPIELSTIDSTIDSTCSVKSFVDDNLQVKIK